MCNFKDKYIVVCTDHEFKVESFQELIQKNFVFLIYEDKTDYTYHTHISGGKNYFIKTRLKNKYLQEGSKYIYNKSEAENIIKRYSRNRKKYGSKSGYTCKKLKLLKISKILGIKGANYES